MYDPKAPSSVLAAAALQEGDVFNVLLGMAKRWCWREEDAEDLLSDAFVRVFNPDDMPWVPAERPFLFHMKAVLRHVAQVRSRRLSTRGEVYDGGETEENRAAEQDGVDDAVSDQRAFDTARMLGRRVRSAMADDPDVIRYLDLAVAHDLERSAQAAALGWTVDKWRSVVKRVAYCAEKVEREWHESEERRMAETRRRASTAGGDRP